MLSTAAGANHNMKVNNIQLYRRLLAYVYPYRSVFFFTLLGMVVVAGTQPIFPYLLNVIIDSGFIGKESETIQMVPIYLILLFLVRAVASFISTYGMVWIGRNVIFDVRKVLFQKMIYLPIGFFDSNRSASLIGKFIYDVEQIASASTNAITTLIKDGLTVIFLMSYLFYLDFGLTFIFLVTSPFIIFYVSIISRKYRIVSESIQDSIGDITHAANEAVQGQRILKTYSGFEFEINHFDGVNKNNKNLAMKKAAVSAVSVPIVEFFIAISLAGLFAYMINQTGQGSSTIGEFVAYVTAVMLLMPPLRRLIKINEPLQMGLSAINTIFTLMDEQPETDDGDGEIKDAIDNIEYREVSFKYTTSSNMVLENISFTIEKNTMVALVGSSGSGKSTIASLLPRFYEPTTGSIYINGLNIKKLSLKSLRNNISIVPQESILFDGTIQENITYGSVGEISEARLEHALKTAHVSEFVVMLRDGLNTQVGERGIKLSGGQQQRISIARAIYKDAPILILDEATSALDAISENHIQAAIENLLNQRTTIVIAHRLTTIMKADKILVIENGVVVEQGTHNELLRKNGVYQKLYMHNFDDKVQKLG